VVSGTRRRLRTSAAAFIYKEEKLMVQDPVCKMTIEESKAAATATYQGKTYYFCAVGCKRKFEENPQQYVPQSR
jgi:YHS domain-containing protein